MNTETMKRVEALRTWMRENRVAAFVTPSTDPHSGEYVPDHWKSREWISGFTGSAGTAVVTIEQAALWTDSRYFLQAAEQISGTQYVLMKDKIEGTPSVADWLGSVLKQGDRVGVDAWCFTYQEYEDLARALTPYGLTLVDAGDPMAALWKDRPAIPHNEVEIQPLKYAGESASSKIERIREVCRKQGGQAVLICQLDEVAWTLNLRGTDVECNPVFVSYLLVGAEKTVLFVNGEKLTPEVKAYLKDESIEVEDYDHVAEVLRQWPASDVILYDPLRSNYGIVTNLQQKAQAECPVTTMKIMKNATEIAGYRAAMLRDGVAMVKWMKWVIPAVEAGGQTELSLTEKLLAFRAEQPLFRGVSFATIMGYAAHGAVVHYEPTPETDIPVLPKSLLLVDSGGQYQDGTTDITRTIPLGPLTDEERRNYTLVLRGFINLGRVVFPRGTYGSQLDVLAREPMWKYGINYLHGTGHGVGSYLNVHEGPHQFRMNYMPQPLVPGMTITDEPGIYIEGRHGVRHENTMLVIDAQPKECTSSEGQTFGPYYTFTPLTLAPIFTWPIVRSMMTQEEIDWFNDYQQHVCDMLAPHLDAEHADWLKEVTQPI